MTTLAQTEARQVMLQSATTATESPVVTRSSFGARNIIVKLNGGRDKVASGKVFAGNGISPTYEIGSFSLSEGDDVGVCPLETPWACYKVVLSTISGNQASVDAFSESQSIGRY